MRPSSVSAINRQVGIKKESRPRLIVIKLKQRQVHSVRVNNANTDELCEQILDHWISLHNPLVQFCTGLARNAAKHNEQWLLRFFGLANSPRQVIVDPEALRLDVLTIVSDFGGSILRQARRRKQHDDGQLANCKSYHGRIQSVRIGFVPTELSVTKGKPNCKPEPTVMLR